MAGRSCWVVVCALFLQAASSASPAALLNEQYAHAGVVVHVAEMGENLPWASPVIIPRPHPLPN